MANTQEQSSDMTEKFPRSGVLVVDHSSSFSIRVGLQMRILCDTVLDKPNVPQTKPRKISREEIDHTFSFDSLDEIYPLIFDSRSLPSLNNRIADDKALCLLLVIAARPPKRGFTFAASALKTVRNLTSGYTRGLVEPSRGKGAIVEVASQHYWVMLQGYIPLWGEVAARRLDLAWSQVCPSRRDHTGHTVLELLKSPRPTEEDIERDGVLTNLRTDAFQLLVPTLGKSISGLGDRYSFFRHKPAPTQGLDTEMAVSLKRKLIAGSDDQDDEGGHPMPNKNARTDDIQSNYVEASTQTDQMMPDFSDKTGTGQRATQDLERQEIDFSDGTSMGNTSSSEFATALNRAHIYTEAYMDFWLRNNENKVLKCLAIDQTKFLTHPNYALTMKITLSLIITARQMFPVSMNTRHLELQLGHVNSWLSFPWKLRDIINKAKERDEQVERARRFENLELKQKELRRKLPEMAEALGGTRGALFQNHLAELMEIDDLVAEKESEETSIVVPKLPGFPSVPIVVKHNADFQHVSSLVAVAHFWHRKAIKEIVGYRIDSWEDWIRSTQTDVREKHDTRIAGRAIVHPLFNRSRSLDRDAPPSHLTNEPYRLSLKSS